jgi:DNA topoisomerase VI subunit B
MPIEKQRQKSPAEFFSDNAAIAGFDNPGKSLYTTVRELVEVRDVLKLSRRL